MTAPVPPTAVEIGALAKWLWVWATKLCHENTTSMASSTATQPAPSRRPEWGGREVLPIRLALVAIISGRSFGDRVAVAFCYVALLHESSRFVAVHHSAKL